MPLRAGVDGGVSDNLGLRGMIEAFQEIEAVSQLLQSSSVPSDHFSFDSVELLSNLPQHRANQRQLDAAQRRIRGMSQAAA